MLLTMPSLLHSVFLALSLRLSSAYEAPASVLNERANVPQRVNLRIEGLTTTIFEGEVISNGHNITTASGGTHHCDGTNNDVNPSPSNTCSSTLDTASRNKHLYSFDGTYSSEFDDFFITSIGPDTQTSTQFWGLLNNFQFTPVGGCQEQTKPGDHVLWAFDAFNKVHILKLSGPNIAIKNKPTTVTVVDGTTGSPVSGATVAGQATDANGNAVLTFNSVGIHKLKAEEQSSLRSNALLVFVA